MIGKIFRLIPLFLLIFLTVFLSESIAEGKSQYGTSSDKYGQVMVSETETEVQGSTVSGDQLYIDSNGGLHKKVPGVGASLGAMLDKLISMTAGSESQMKQIIGNLPILFPDLYKVFVTL